RRGRARRPGAARGARARCAARGRVGAGHAVRVGPGGRRRARRARRSAPAGSRRRRRRERRRDAVGTARRTLGTGAGASSARRADRAGARGERRVERDCAARPGRGARTRRAAAGPRRLREVGMLFLRETHEVIGEREAEFESAFRDRWIPTLAETPGARLLYYLRHAHGSDPSYHVVTWTAIRDGVAWEELVRRVDAGSLREPARALDRLRHDVTGKVFLPLPWSPLQRVDL